MPNILLVGEITHSGKSTYYWKIPNFSKYSDIGALNYVVSPVFCTSNNGEGFKWQLKYDTMGSPMSTRKFICLAIECFSDDFLMATITAGILKNNNAIVMDETIEYRKHHIAGYFLKLADQGFIMNPANGILNDDVLTFFCKIEMGTDYPLPVFDFHISGIEDKSSDKNNDLQSHKVRLRLEDFDDFENLLSDPDFSDVKISIENKTVMAHKCILAKRSPVFSAMFRSDMRELRNNDVEVKDIKYDIFMELLRFIYSGKVNQLQVIAMDLLVAADMYQLENLKILCEIELMKQLGVDNAVQILKLADKHRVERLKKQAIGYIVENKKDIFDQAEFYGMGHELTYEVCQAMK